MERLIICNLEKEFKRFRRYKVFSRFLRFVQIEGNDDSCWLWLGSKDGKGYGYFEWSEKHINSAHIASYELFIGQRHGKCVCHSCDNPSCVNPRHLWLGTRAQNNKDRDIKGRTARGSAKPNFKLTTTLIAKILEKYATGKYTRTELARKYKVSYGSVWGLLNRTKGVSNYVQ